MTREQAINYLRSSGMSDEQIDAVVSAIERTQTHSCDNQYCIQNGGDICDRVHCPIGQKQTFYDDITDEREQLDFVQKHERIPVTLDVQTHGDIISRQAAIGAIVGMTTMGIDELVNAGNKERFDWIKGLSDSLVKIINLPSVQPEVVRCKDCKFYSPMNRETKTGICNLTMHQNFGDNWFCAGAERRTDEAD